VVHRDTVLDPTDIAVAKVSRNYRNLEVVKAEQRRSAFFQTMINDHVLQHLTRTRFYISCLRTIAYVFRFATILRGGKMVEASLNPDELRRASYSVVDNIQQQSLMEDFLI